MRWSNGLDVARAIRERDRNTVLIFVSRMAQYAVQGYSVDAMDYILKPVEYAGFEKSCGRRSTMSPLTARTRSGSP